VKKLIEVSNILEYAQTRFKIYQIEKYESFKSKWPKAYGSYLISPKKKNKERRRKD
jgi:ribosomal protein L32E